ncbi:glycosyltransferase [Patescibacteria group bacterium]|nr:glycosyltransferase [Patescibacteria group bacterium]
MKICVGIPSYNEADRISFVTSQIDKGLTLLQDKYPKIESSVILDADNCSSDNTTYEFNSTPTTSQKDTILTSGDPGKGKNVLAILKYAVEKNFDAVLTIDADLESITPEWIVEFSELVINNKADFVYPEYKRNRFEGSTTNHFAYPLLYAYFGKDMRQPIGGDFAMSVNYARHILHKNIPAGAYKYGIDVFLSMNAVAEGFAISMARLGKKIHKPSFLRMREMFPQIAASAMETMRAYDRSSTFESVNHTGINIIDKTVFTHLREAELIRQEECANLVSMLDGQVLWLDKKLAKELKSFFPDNFSKFDSDHWVAVLGEWVSFMLKNPNINSQKHACELLPFFVVRAVNFWNESKTQSASWVENKVRQQAANLKKYLDNK